VFGLRACHLTARTNPFRAERFRLRYFRNDRDLRLCHGALKFLPQNWPSRRNVQIGLNHKFNRYVERHFSTAIASAQLRGCLIREGF